MARNVIGSRSRSPRSQRTQSSPPPRRITLRPRDPDPFEFAYQAGQSISSILGALRWDPNADSNLIETRYMDVLSGSYPTRTTLGPVSSPSSTNRRIGLQLAEYLASVHLDKVSDGDHPHADLVLTAFQSGISHPVSRTVTVSEFHHARREEAEPLLTLGDYRNT